MTTESKTVNETIHYVYTDGTIAHDDYVAQPITFTRTVSTDAVTGEKTYGGWSAAQQFDQQLRATHQIRAKLVRRPLLVIPVTLNLR
ncbi:mucin-binding protein [Lactiplantibacillus plantarum]|uniref:mucin-binding protein n=1 Tax=Lactiplantibacillus plantarum TaxID=1590 RepID=UPI003A4D1DD1